MGSSSAAPSRSCRSATARFPTTTRTDEPIARVYEYDDQGRLLGWAPQAGSTAVPPTWTRTGSGVTIEGDGDRVEVKLDAQGRIVEVRGFHPGDTRISLMTWRWREDGLLDGFFLETWGG